MREKRLSCPLWSSISGVLVARTENIVSMSWNGWVHRGMLADLSDKKGAALGLAISDKKIIPQKAELTEQMVYSDRNPAVPWKRKLSEFCSEPL